MLATLAGKKKEDADRGVIGLKPCLFLGRPSRSGKRLMVAEVLLGFHMLPLRLKDVLRSSTTLLIGEAGKLLYNYARLHWKNREN